jgi:hypothetical protein
MTKEDMISNQDISMNVTSYLFMVLADGCFSRSDYKMSNDTISSEQWIGKFVEKIAVAQF